MAGRVIYAASGLQLRILNPAAVKGMRAARSERAADGQVNRTGRLAIKQAVSRMVSPAFQGRGSAEEGP